MEKKLISFLVAFVMLPFLGVFSVNHAFASEADFTFTDNGNGTATITDYIGLSKDVIIPDTIGGLTVTNIGSSAFRGNDLTSVTIPDSVTSIGSDAFAINALTSVIIPDSVTAIGSSAFENNKLTSVVIPEGITEIKNMTFWQNELTSVSIPDSVTKIGQAAFSFNQLTSVVIPDRVTSIGDDAFARNQLTEITIPASVASFNDGFFNTNPLTSVTVLNPNAEITISYMNYDYSNVTFFGFDPSTTKDYAATKGSEFEEIIFTTNTAKFTLAGGKLTVSVPPLLSFENIVLQKQPTTYSTSFSSVFNIKDLTGTQQGWRLDVSAEPLKVVTPENGFAEGTSAYQLPKGSLSLAPLENIERVGSGTGALPTNDLLGNVIIDDGPVTVTSAQPGTGMGEFNLTFPSEALFLTVDATTAKVDVVNYSKELTPYETTLTWNIVSAP